jgi:sulfatase maturation enzyme AslB (radical SAM superfamily)
MCGEGECIEDDIQLSGSMTGHVLINPITLIATWCHVTSFRRNNVNIKLSLDGMEALMGE